MDHSVLGELCSIKKKALVLELKKKLVDAVPLTTCSFNFLTRLLKLNTPVQVAFWSKHKK